MLGASLYLTGVDAQTGEYVANSSSCSMCKRQVINAGITKVYVRDDKDSYRVVDVAMQVGYRNASSFTRALRAVVGVTPNQYRRNVKRGL